jgi:putative oxidoreductase
MATAPDGMDCSRQFALRCSGSSPIHRPQWVTRKTAEPTTARLFAPMPRTDKLPDQRPRQWARFSPAGDGEGENEASTRGTSMTDATQRYYVPALGGIYATLNDYAEAILRIGLGGILIPHGCQKLFGMFGGMGLSGNAALFDRIGYSPGMFWGTLVGCTELIGGILLILGLFTRFAAAAVLIFMIVAVKFTSAKGFFWSNGGFEFPLLLGLCALFFLIRGGGPLSLDRMIGREI